MVKTQSPYTVQQRYTWQCPPINHSAVYQMWCSAEIQKPGRCHQTVCGTHKCPSEHHSVLHVYRRSWYIQRYGWNHYSCRSSGNCLHAKRFRPLGSIFHCKCIHTPHEASSRYHSAQSPDHTGILLSMQDSQSWAQLVHTRQGRKIHRVHNGCEEGRLILKDRG